MTNILIIIAVAAAYLIFKQLTGPKVDHITGTQLDALMKDTNVKRQYIDVRTPQEFGTNKIKGFKNIPVGTLPSRLGEVDKEQPVVLICASGARSMQAASILSKAGYTQITNVKGGMSLYKA